MNNVMCERIVPSTRPKSDLSKVNPCRPQSGANGDLSGDAHFLHSIKYVMADWKHTKISEKNERSTSNLALQRVRFIQCRSEPA